MNLINKNARLLDSQQPYWDNGTSIQLDRSFQGGFASYGAAVSSLYYEWVRINLNSFEKLGENRG